MRHPGHQPTQGRQFFGMHQAVFGRLQLAELVLVLVCQRQQQLLRLQNREASLRVPHCDGFIKHALLARKRSFCSNVDRVLRL